MRLQLTFAAGSYDFVRPLADGTIKPDGIDLVVLSGMGSGERHHRMGHGQEFDAGPYRLFNSYHCSRLNTNTGRLTTPMFEAVFERVKAHLDQGAAARR